MKRYLPAFITGGILGFLIGLALGFLHWSPAWPRLSLFSAFRSGATGWVAGAAISPLLFWLGRRAQRAQGEERPRGISLTLTSGALAPFLLWWAIALPGGQFRQLTPVSRRPWDTRPNLILISIDALRADHLGAYGNRRGLTPNLDAFAREATQYDSAYASSPWTLTSLGSTFTSLPPSQCGLKTVSQKPEAWYRGWARLAGDFPLLSEQLQQAGYATAADLTNVFLEADRGWTRGFDYYRNEGGVDGTSAPRAHARSLTENTLAWLRLNRRQPLFLWLHYLDPHCPYDSPETPAALRARFPSHWVARRERWDQRIRQAPRHKQLVYQEFCRVMYDEEVRYVDHWVGRLIAGLKDSGLYDNSLVVITADHGEEIFDRGDLDHGHSLHEEVLSVPLLVKWPRGAAADRRITATVASADLAPTLLQFAEAPAIQASERLPLPTREGERAEQVYSEGLLYGQEQTALTTDRYKVIYHPGDPNGGRFEVYDRSKDRRERHDLVATDAALGLRARLKQLTRSAEAAAREWEEAGGLDQPLDLSQQAKQRLRALGYLGN